MSGASRADTLTILKLLAKGRPPAFIAQATEIPIGAVVAVAESYGWPDMDRTRSALHDLELDAATKIPVRTEPPTPRVSPGTGPAPTTSRPAPRSAQPGAHPSGPAPGGTSNGAPPRPALTVDELVRACKRSEFKRTQSLGVKLTELAERITTALRSERETAEMRAKRAEELAAAQAEVKRLTKALAEAKARAIAAGAVGGARGGERECPECGDKLANPQALGAHKRHKHGTPGTSKTPRSTT